MSYRPYEVEEEPHTTAILDPPGPPGPPAPADAPGWRPPGQPERDRVWVHLVWEAVLAAITVAAISYVAATHSEAFGATGLRNVEMQVATLGLVATGLAFSLRAGVPNLAVGAIAAGSGILVGRMVTEADWSYATAIPMTILAAAAVGAVLGAVVVGFNVPAWAASLGMAALVIGVSLQLIDNPLVALADAPDLSSTPWLWAGAFVVISVAGGALWLVPGVRRGFGAMRQDRDAARRPAPGGAFGGLLALIVSSALASGGGVLSAMRLQSANFAGFETFTYLALGAVLLGGVSAFGRRGGLFGTVLGVVLLTVVQQWIVLEGIKAAATLTLAGVAIVAGLVVNRLLETLGRKRAAPPQYG
jgi:ribose/xylose/arabinose/galactoside ABC-type transport system permease subunit